MKLGPGTLTLAIIGSSHFLEVRAGEQALSELLSCPRRGLDETDCVLRRPISDCPPVASIIGSISYRFAVARFAMDRDNFAEAVANLQSPSSNRLAYLFPGPGSIAHAVTCLEWRAEGGRADIVTYHTYPDELTIVRTNSVIDVADTGAAA